MYLGVHVSIAGKIYESLDRAHALGCNTLQIFSRNPRQWRSLELSDEDVQEFHRRRKALGIEKIVVHIPYLLNLASPYKTLWKNSVKAYVEDLNETQRLGAEYLVTHMGSHSNTTELGGIQRFSDALNKIIDKTKGNTTKLLLENTSGSGSWLGYKFLHSKIIMDRVKEPERLGICLDTAHAFTAGYDLRTSTGLESMLDEINELIGLEKLHVVHFNDSKKEFKSNLDHHEHIGAGKIGVLALKRIITHPKLKDLVFILETPRKEQYDDPKNLKLVRRLMKSRSPKG